MVTFESFNEELKESFEKLREKYPEFVKDAQFKLLDIYSMFGARYSVYVNLIEVEVSKRTLQGLELEFRQGNKVIKTKSNSVFLKKLPISFNDWLLNTYLSLYFRVLARIEEFKKEIDFIYHTGIFSDLMKIHLAEGYLLDDIKKPSDIKDILSLKNPYVTKEYFQLRRFDYKDEDGNDVKFVINLEVEDDNIVAYFYLAHPNTKPATSYEVADYMVYLTNVDDDYLMSSLKDISEAAVKKIYH